MIFLAVVVNRNNRIDHQVVESGEPVVLLLAMVVSLQILLVEVVVHK